MKLRVLRIAWSVACGSVCVMLIALWVRSHYWVDQVYVPVAQSAFISLGSSPDVFGVGLTDRSPNGAMSMVNMPTVDWLAALFEATEVPWSGAMTFDISADGIMMPHWFGVLLAAGFGTVPWLRWRFSIRTLLIATTLVAVLLGLAVYVAKR